MGIVLVVFAIAGFGFGAFWAAGFAYVAMNDHLFSWYVSVPLATIAGIVGGLVCGAGAGLGMAYLTLGRN